MRADYQVRLVLAKQFDEWPCVEFVEREPAALVLPGLVELVVEPAGHFRHFVDEIDVGLRVEIAKEFVRVVEHVEVLDFTMFTSRFANLCEGSFKRLRRANVARARGGGE